MERASSGRRGDEGAAGREARAISFRSREDGVLLLDRSSLVRDFHGLLPSRQLSGRFRQRNDTLPGSVPQKVHHYS